MKIINKNKKTKSKIKTILILLAIITLIIITSTNTFSVQTLMSFQGKVRDSSGNLVDDGNLTVHIYDAASGGNLIYNSSNDFLYNITGGYYDVVLGSTGTELNLLYGSIYYMEILINGEELSLC